MKNINNIFTLIFGVAAFLFFGIAYPHHLHYQEQFQLFLFDCSYAWEIIKLPGGIADYLGRFCTQFFLYAWAGAFIISLLLTAVQLLTLRLANWGRFYGASFIPSCLLWLFMLDENALLGGVWAVLITLLATWGYDKLPEGWVKRIAFILAIPLLYWMAGPVCVAFLLLQIPHKRLRNTHHEIIAWSLGMCLCIIMPIVLSHYLPTAANSLWTGIHYHRYPTVLPECLWYSALLLVLLPLLASFLQRWAKASTGFLLPLLNFIVVATICGSLVWRNSNFKAEKVMQYDFMARHQQWNRILETIDKEKPNNQIGVTVQNLALAMRGQLIAHGGEYNQNGLLGLLPEVQRDATSSLPTAEALYQLGMTYAAQRTVFEAQEAILDFQKSARCYKRLAQTNLIIGSYEVSRKYLLALQKTLFYRDFANETLALLNNEEAIAKHPEYGYLRRMSYDKDFYFSDQITPQMLQNLYTSNTDNRIAYEYMMAAFLLTGDSENFYKFASVKQ